MAKAQKNDPTKEEEKPLVDAVEAKYVKMDPPQNFELRAAAAFLVSIETTNRNLNACMADPWTASSIPQRFQADCPSSHGSR